MKGIMLTIVPYLLFVCCVAEKKCSSYHYEEQTLAKVVRLEYRLERLEDKVNNECKDCKEVLKKISNECPEAWIRFKESCYLFEEKKYPFIEARSHCQRLGADLVHVNDFIENEFIRRHLRTLQSVDLWIGLEDTAKEGVYKWVDDKTTPSFTSWNSGQPDNGGGKEDCVHFRSTYNYNWNDDQCNKAFGSIGEMKAKE